MSAAQRQEQIQTIRLQDLEELTTFLLDHLSARICNAAWRSLALGLRIEETVTVLVVSFLANHYRLDTYHRADIAEALAPLRKLEPVAVDLALADTVRCKKPGHMTIITVVPTPPGGLCVRSIQPMFLSRGGQS